MHLPRVASVSVLPQCVFVCVCVGGGGWGVGGGFDIKACCQGGDFHGIKPL